MQNFNELAKDIKLLILDVDGVCTDGKLYFDKTGECMKVFHVHDGAGMKLLQRSGVTVAFITAKKSEALQQRAKALGIEHVYAGFENKIAPYQDLLGKLNLTDSDVAYVGDDLPDLTLIRRVKLGITVPNARPFIQKHADYVTEKPGGHGAVREVCEKIMEAQGTLEASLAQYL
jgi:3-deoxy-D-manno-octulosonate 8-phosphate phosphatase (KDO 8-P phosphatase)